MNGHARFPHPNPNPLDKATSHSTELQKTAAKSLVIPHAGEGTKDSLRESHNDEMDAGLQLLPPQQPALLALVLASERRGYPGADVPRNLRWNIGWPSLPQMLNSPP